MAKQGVEISYNENLGPLEKVLGGVKRAGDFFVRDTVEVPLPKVEVEGVGMLSFPLPGQQAKELVEQAELAPYGRGPETVLDTSVRKVWQLPAGKVRISGKSWGENFNHILSRVAAGLGCGRVPVSAELYKLLVYDKGGFFLAHRDTEKSPGMFGTLVVVLPSPHQGGNLMVRHAGREATLDLHNVEVSELTFAAFYADCEHEVQPITEGHRLCLVYNLLQQPGPAGPKRKEPLEAPLYDQEAGGAARLLKQALTEPAAPAKLAWLLEHHYTQAELSFGTLKNADAARAKVLVEAATRAGCAVHLGIVHIEESGAAESSYGYSGGRSRWSRYAEEEEEEGDEGEDVDFEIVEACDSQEYVDGWIDPHNRKVDFGPVPLADGELLPNGALDDEKPDQQRYMEASGNEGASYERSYHRAAVVIWRQECYAEVLLQAGVGAAVPYLTQRSQAASAPSASEESRQEVRELARLLVDRWNPTPESWYLGPEAKSPDRSGMLEALCKIRDLALLDRFIAEIVSRQYDGTENSALARAAKLLGPAQVGNLFAHLVSANMRWFPQACVDLLRRLLKLRTGAAAAKWPAALLKVATAAVANLGDIQKVPPAAVEFEFEEKEESALADEEEQSDAAETELDWQRRQKVKPPDSSMVVELLDSLADMDAQQLRESAVRTLAAQAEVFDPVQVLVPALAALHREKAGSVKSDPVFVRLWHHAADFLLARSERPPEPPKDWHQETAIKCQCEDCRALQRFARDPSEQVHRFPAASERRRHLHSTIDQYRLDMTHVTERKGRPYTLVCTKTRRGFERRCEQYHEEIAAMAALIPLSPEPLTEPTGRPARLKAAIARSQGVARPRGAAKKRQ